MQEFETVYSPRRSKGKLSHNVLSEKSAIDSEDDIDALNEEETSMKDLIAQINLMNDKIPKRLEKF